jgi:cellulose synthase/poly-beta-1,6-N-acetylglucosamine synthase-like glycosyltransferase
MPERDVTVMIPAYNEARVIGDTLLSLRSQTRQPDRILVVDDGSNDGTGHIATAWGAEVVRPESNTGFKAGAMNVGLHHVDTEWLVTVDADTILAPNALQEMVAAAQEEDVGAACGLVLPQRIRTLWERARFVEYLLAFGVLKPVQDWYHGPMVASGCFALYKTEVIKALGGFPTETVGEDLDLTWRLYQAGRSIKYVSGAVCYPVEPPNLRLMHRQLRRWSHGFVQNVRLHGNRILHVPMLRSFVIVTVLDSMLAVLLYLLLGPLLLLSYGWRFLLALYLADMLLMIIPVAWMGYRLGLMRQALASLPFVFVLRMLNVYHFGHAVLLECILRRPLQVFEKGH